MLLLPHGLRVPDGYLFAVIRSGNNKRHGLLRNCTDVYGNTDDRRSSLSVQRDPLFPLRVQPYAGIVPDAVLKYHHVRVEML